MNLILFRTIWIPFAGGLFFSFIVFWVVRLFKNMYYWSTQKRLHKLYKFGIEKLWKNFVTGLSIPHGTKGGLPGLFDAQWKSMLGERYIRSLGSISKMRRYSTRSFSWSTQTIRIWFFLFKSISKTVAWNSMLLSLNPITSIEIPAQVNVYFLVNISQYSKSYKWGGAPGSTMESRWYINLFINIFRSIMQLSGKFAERPKASRPLHRPNFSGISHENV